MDVNDDACFLEERVALKSIASELAPTTNGGDSFSSHYRCVAIQISSPA